ncbi:MAG: ABC transporter ATP-binding protein/permease [Lachnospiraceae bacterium]|nr:ABC transporter ATP-binding protein/permease [Lachnospiraceae bacterium]
MKSVFDILKKLNYVVNSKQKRQYVLVTIVALIGSFWELLGVAAIYPFIQTVMTPQDAEASWYSGIVQDMFGDVEPLTRMTILGILVILIYVVKNLYLMFSSYVQTAYATSVQRDLSIRMTDTYLRSSYLFHLENNSSSLIRSINQDVVGVFGMFYYVFRLLAELFTIIALCIFIVMLDPILAISLMLILGSCMLILFLGMKRTIKRLGKKQQQCESRMLQYLTQAFNGIKEIMVKNRQEQFVGVFKEAATENAKATKINTFFNSINTYIYEIVCIGGLLAIVIVRFHMIDDVANYMTRLSAVAIAAFRLFPAMGRVNTNLNGMVYNRSRLNYLYETLQTIENSKEYLMKREEEQGSLSFNDCIGIRNLGFRYPRGREDVLENVNLTVKKGESVALIGASGAGKTTLADVILGLLRPQKGQILADGEDVYWHPAAWASLIGYVPQNVYLTDDTIRGNVAFGVQEGDVDEERVWKALEEAQLADFVRSQEEGLDTMVGERGVRISGGQRQRIAIARALYDNPQILVLDEATSALDNETETAVMEAIDSLHGNKTMIIVAHRLSTIRNCDAIYEICNGVAVKRDKEEVLRAQA